MAANYYDILGISRSATEKDVRQAFRRLARQYHPDVNPGDKAAEQKFKEINEAYEALSDPEKRKKYDRFGENWKYADRMPQDDGRPGAGQFRWDFRGDPHAGVGVAPSSKTSWEGAASVTLPPRPAGGRALSSRLPSALRKPSTAPSA